MDWQTILIYIVVAILIWLVVLTTIFVNAERKKRKRERSGMYPEEEATAPEQANIGFIEN